MDDLEKGDLCYFPSGHPHSLQGLAPGGTEFLLIFDDGNFSEESTFLLNDWLAQTPKNVISQNFRLAPEIFDCIPKAEKYIFQGFLPGPIDKENPSGSQIKKSKLQFTHKMLKQKAMEASGGHVRITNTTVFPLSRTVSAAHVTINPGGMREMHWHPNADEWSYFIRGRARVTIFAAEGDARTFNYTAGDVGIVPANMAHYVQKLSEDEEVEFLEIFRSDRFLDFSLQQWLGETPARMVSENLFNTDKKAGEKFLEELKKHEGEKDVVREHSTFKQVPRRHSDGDRVQEAERVAARVIEEQQREIEQLKLRLRKE